MQQLSAGATLQGGKYIIEKVLGQGGFGITYLAIVAEEQRKVAIKEYFLNMGGCYCKRDGSQVIPATYEAQMTFPTYRNKFYKEAINAAKFNHPNIVKIISTFEENVTAYIVMDYIDGISLAETIKTSPLDITAALKLFKDICGAINYAHKAKVMHLDIKPSNIMLRKSDNTPILIDFGLSKHYNNSGEQTTMTPSGISDGYAPHEQYEIDGVTSFSPQTDIYALGATFYTMITGRVPLPSIYLSGNIPLQYPNPIDDYISSAIRKATEYNKENRFKTVKDFLSALNLNTKSAQSIDSDKPIIKSFQLKSSSPYYIDDEIELSWNIQNADAVYLNGKTQYGLRKSKTIKYDSSGKKRLTLKVVKGELEVSRTINFEILPKIEETAQQESTRVILADIVEGEKPVIHYFKRSGAITVFEDDMIQLGWKVDNTTEINLNNSIIPLEQRRIVVKLKRGMNVFVLNARNDTGNVSKSLYINGKIRCAEKGRKEEKIHVAKSSKSMTDNSPIKNNNNESISWTIITILTYIICAGLLLVFIIDTIRSWIC